MRPASRPTCRSGPRPPSTAGPAGAWGFWPFRPSGGKGSRPWCSHWPSCSPRPRRTPLWAAAQPDWRLALLIAFAMYRLGKRLNVALFFTVIGAVLMIFAAGILVDAVQNLQELGWLPILTHPMWNTSHILSEDSTVGDIFHSFFGYADSPTIGQAVVYVTYLTVAVGAFIAWRPPGRTSPARRPAVAPATRAHLPTI